MKRKVAMVYMSDYRDWPMGGMLSYVKNMIPHICSHADWEVDLWGSTIDGKITNYDVNGHKINTYTNVKTRNKIVPNFVVSFINIIRNRKFFNEYDILYSHTSATSIALKLCYPRKFLVHHQHGLSYKDSTGLLRLFNVGYTIAQMLSDVSFFVASEEEVQKHKSSPMFKNKRFYSIGSPIDYQEIVGTVVDRGQDETVRFIYTGRMDGWKNVDLLVDSFIKYHQSNENSLLHMIGDGPAYEQLKEKVLASAAEDYILLPGRMAHEDIVRYLKHSDIFLFPSKGEGVSLSILEAFAAGVPAVGFDVMGVRNYVINNQTGILVAQQNADAFADGIQTAQVSYKAYSENCIKFAANYDSQTITSQIMKIIDLEYA